MDKVKNIRLIEYPNPNLFMDELKRAIAESQSLGLDVEIQYSREKNTYSALLINRKVTYTA